MNYTLHVELAFLMGRAYYKGGTRGAQRQMPGRSKILTSVAAMSGPGWRWFRRISRSLLGGSQQRQGLTRWDRLPCHSAASVSQLVSDASETGVHGCCCQNLVLQEVAHAVRSRGCVSAGTFS